MNNEVKMEQLMDDFTGDDSIIYGGRKHVEELTQT
jgi:hypothetical protein